MTDRYCHLCSYPVIAMMFPMRGNICFDCEVTYTHDIDIDSKGKVKLMGRKKDWLRTARGSGHYPMTFNFVLQMNSKFVQCSYCGCEIPEKEVTRDHIYPKSKGGIIKTPCCVNCNIVKEDMKPIEWAMFASEMGYDLSCPSIDKDKRGEQLGDIH